MKEQQPEPHETPENNETSEQSPEQKKQRIKKIVMGAIIIALAVICFAFSIVAMSSAVTYFSYMFGLTGQLIAKAYLKLYYGWYMALTYMAIFGFVIVVADTAVFFTQFSQKERILWLHLVFYLLMFICGIVALAGNSDYRTRMTLNITKTCVPLDFECNLALRFFIYRGQVTSYFIGYCICFFAYAALYHYASYCQKRQKQQQTLKKLEKNESHMQQINNKNISFMSQEQN